MSDELVGLVFLVNLARPCIHVLLISSVSPQVVSFISMTNLSVYSLMAVLDRWWLFTRRDIPSQNSNAKWSSLRQAAVSHDGVTQV